jgi:predicted amidohydrolase YtcJ
MPHASGSADSAADLVVLGADIRTADHRRPRATALAARAGLLVFVGDDGGARARIGPGTRVIEARGALVLPGLIDSHGHMRGLGDALAQVDLAGTASLGDVIRRAAAGPEQDGWIIGRGWDQNDWTEARFPHHGPLSAAIPDRPVYLRRVDGHAALVNARTLDAAGITRATPDPPGGLVLRDGDGEPTGVLVDNAMDLVTPLLPKPTPASIRASIERAQSHCLERGITLVGDAGIDEPARAVYRDMLAEGVLRLRIHAMVDAPGDAFEAALKRGPEVDPRGFFTLRAIKLYADGALGSRGAAMLAPYSDDPMNRGLLLRSRADLLEICCRAVARGFQPCVHAIGDRANRLVLDVFEEMLAAYPGRDIRPRIEHAQVLAPEDIPRFSRLGVIASMQPIHCVADLGWVGGRLGSERARGAYAWRSLLDAGARLAAGSDFPVESADPLLGIHAAMTRRTPEGTREGGWNAGECLGFEEALQAWTSAGAQAAFLEDRIGMLARGLAADFAILEGLRPDDPLSFLRGRVRATYVAGRRVWPSCPPDLSAS